MRIKQALVMTLGTAAVVGAGLWSSNDTANADTRVTVKQGDSVWALADKYKTSVAAIEKANSLSDSSLIYVGQALSIPAKTSSTAAAHVAPHTYHVATTKSSKATHDTASASTGVSGSEASAKAWIAYHESRGSYTVTNGQYIGKYQLSASYLKGDYSAANQEKVANEYVADRYGSWAKAQAFWQANGWY